jgi:acyl-CoA synthetase (AMP-forming)/AMP-acid ligase II
MREFLEHGPAVSQQTIPSLLIARAARQPCRVAYTFLSGNSDEELITYAELDRRAKAIGYKLSELGAQGRRVALLYPPGIDYIAAFFGCMYAGSIAVPALPPDPRRLDRSLPRTAAILRDAAPSIVLTTSDVGRSLPFLLECAGQFQVRVVSTDSQSEQAPLAWEPASADQDSVAVLHYTSGSTATPKGVVLTNRNLIDNSEHIYRFFGHSEESRGMLWLPPHHDMGLIGGIIQPLYGGFPITLMAPEDFMRRPVRWLEEITRIGATTSGGPNFAYDMCVQKITADERRQLDLSSWQVAFNGSEPVRAETMERFAQAFGPTGFRRAAFRPCYGLAEATLIVTGGVIWSSRNTKSVTLQPDPATARAASTPSRRVVSCGLAVPGHRLAIVDPDTHVEQAPGQIGEIWISGASVAQGYWRRREETAEIFCARLAGTSEGPFLRSGDLGFVLGDQLFVTGRIKEMIVVDGSSHYPQDIELTAQLSASVLRPGCGAAFTAMIGGKERLVIAHEVRSATSPVEVGALEVGLVAGGAVLVGAVADGAVNAGAVAGAIRIAVAAEHGIAVHTVVLVPPGGIPKTTSGKIQRRRCAVMFENGQLPVLRQGTEVYDPKVGRALRGRTLRWPAPPEKRAEPLPGYRRSSAATTGRFDEVPTGLPLPGPGNDTATVVSGAHSMRANLGINGAMPAADQPGSRCYRWLSGSRVPAEQLAAGESRPRFAPRPNLR